MEYPIQANSLKLKNGYTDRFCLNLLGRRHSDPFARFVMTYIPFLPYSTIKPAMTEWETPDENELATLNEHVGGISAEQVPNMCIPSKPPGVFTIFIHGKFLERDMDVVAKKVYLEQLKSSATDEGGIHLEVCNANEVVTDEAWFTKDEITWLADRYSDFLDVDKDSSVFVALEKTTVQHSAVP